MKKTSVHTPRRAAPRKKKGLKYHEKIALHFLRHRMKYALAMAVLCFSFGMMVKAIVGGVLLKLSEVSMAAVAEAILSRHLE